MNKRIERDEVNKGGIKGKKNYPKRDKKQYSNGMRFDIVIVLGVHRSGTSAITKGLELFGVDLGQNLLPANEYNPKGYFEDNQLVDLNDNILRKSGSLWSALQFLEPEDLLGARFEKEQNEAREFLKGKLAQGTPIGLKDPRLCRTLPLWQKIFEELGLRVGYLLAYRSPDEVAASLKKRDDFSIEYGENLWASYQMDVLRHLNSKKWLVIKYENLLKKPRRELRRVAEFLGAEWHPEDSKSLEYQKRFLDSSLRHHRKQTRTKERFRFIRPLILGMELLARTSNSVCRWSVRAAAELVFNQMRNDPVFSILEKRITWSSRLSRPGFWRRLERSSRKRRKKWINRIGFDQDWYLKEYPNVKEAGMDPLSHFIEFGQKEGRHKNAKQQEVHGKASAAFNINRQKDLASSNNILKQEKIFDENFYLEKYPDVKETKMKAWDHFVRHGHHEGRLVHKIDFSLITSEVSLSVIIPTCNGQQKISRTIEAISKASHGLDIELIIVNDGSSDQTESVVQALSSKIKNIKLISIKQSGAGIARNTGAKVASKQILLFMGDDISPIGPQFFNVHAVLHKINPQINYSVLGKVEWPDDSYFPITPVMEHIQGSGGEQFGYTDMRPNMFWDWRFFYTCNVSVKRQVVSDWEAEGFDTSFAGCGFEDTEFACRMSKKYGSFNIFYSDQSVGSHYHHHTFLTFFQRQALCGSQLTNLIKLHPECAGKTGVEEVLKILNKNNRNDPELAYKTLESIRQIKRLTLDLEAGGLLGRYEWHKELLHATFRLAYFLGFLNSHAKPNQGYAEALTYIFNNAVRPLVPHLPTSFARP